jgi:GNAT superfamily N-acetyltransferase
MKILIRPIKTREFEELAELTNDAYKIPYKPGFLITRANDSVDKIKEEIASGAEIFVAELDGKMAGAMRANVFDRALMFYKLAVSGDFRKRGIGGQLIKYVSEYYKKLGFNKIKIEVSESKGLIPYYKSLGFVVIERYLHKNHYEVLMEKKL